MSRLVRVGTLDRCLSILPARRAATLFLEDDNARSFAPEISPKVLAGIALLIAILFAVNARWFMYRLPSRLTISTRGRQNLFFCRVNGIGRIHWELSGPTEARGDLQGQRRRRSHRLP